MNEQGQDYYAQPLHHGLVGQERYHQQAIRRGSPLARNHPSIYDIPEQIVNHEGPAIDAPVPKHRHQLSLTLQKEYEGSQHENQKYDSNNHIQIPEEGFATNPVSPAPLLNFPDQPDMPAVEVDVHNGPELEDDNDADKQNELPEKDVFQTDPNTPLHMPDAPEGHAQFMAQNKYADQHDFDQNDPVEHSAMSMLMAGQGLPNSSMMHSNDDHMSEGGRTNISDIVTNPSEPPSPGRRFSNAASSHGHGHAHHISNTSASHWMPEKQPPKPVAASTTSSVSKPKFNPAATEFKFDPTTSFNFKSYAAPPPVQEKALPPTPPSQPTFGAFGPGFDLTAASFQPTFGTSGFAQMLAQKGNAMFSPNAPEFTPSYVKTPIQPTPDGLFGDIVKPPPPGKKVIPIVPPTEEEEEEADRQGKEDDDFEQQNQGGRKRMKQMLRDGNDVPMFAQQPAELPTEEASKEIMSPIEKTAGSHSADEADSSMEAAVKSPHIVQEIEHGTDEFTFVNKEDAVRFASVVPTQDTLAEREGTKIQDTPSPRPLTHLDEDTAEADNAAPEQAAEHHAPILDFNPESPVFTLRPSTQDFNFNFHHAAVPPKQPSPRPSPLPSPSPDPIKRFGGLGDSRYANTPSPPPMHPAPDPPIAGSLVPVATFLPPREASPFDETSDDHKNAHVSRPTDQELDDVFMYMDNVESDAGVVRVETEHDDGTVVTEELFVDGASLDMSIDTPLRLQQAIRSAGPSPSPRRAEQAIYRHRAASFSPDEDSGDQTQENSMPQYGSADQLEDEEEENSDWENTFEDNNKLRPQSKLFFDEHVEELVGGLFERRLEPVLKSLTGISDALVTLSNASSLTSSSAAKAERNAHSDADDEEDDESRPPVSARERKLEQIKAAVAEVFKIQKEGEIDNTDQQLREIKTLVSEIASKPLLSPPVQEQKIQLPQRSHEEDFKRIEKYLIDAFASTMRKEDLHTLQEALDEVRESITDRTPLAALQQSVLEAVSKMAKAEDIAVLRHTLRDVIAHSAQKGDVLDVKASIDQIANKIAIVDDVRATEASLLENMRSIARKDDLVPIHHILAETFNKAAKSEELVDYRPMLSNILDGVQMIDVNMVRQDVQQLSAETQAARGTLSEVARLTQDQSEVVERAVKENGSALERRLGEVVQVIQGVQKFVQSRASKDDMRRGLVEKEQREDMAAVRKDVKETVGMVKQGFLSQPTVEDIKAAVQEMQPKLPALSEIRDTVKQLPTLQQVEEVVRKAAVPVPTVDDFRHAVDEDREQHSEQIRTVILEATKPQYSLNDIRSMMEDVLTKHQPVVEVSDAAEELSSIKKLLDQALQDKNYAEHHADEQFRSKMEWQEKAIELEKKLKLAEEEAAHHKEIAEEKDAHLKAVEEKRHQTLTSAQMRSALLEGAHAALQKSVGELSVKNAALEGTISEARESEEKHKENARKLEDENRELRRVVETMRAEMEESIRTRDGYRIKFDRVQEELQRVSNQVAAEHATYTRGSEESKARTDVLEAQLTAETNRVQRLQQEVQRLENAEKEAIKLRIELEGIQRNSQRLNEYVAEVRRECEGLQHANGELSRELEMSRQKLQEDNGRLNAAIQAQVQEADAKTAAVRSAMEKELEESRDELDRVRMNSTEQVEKLEQQLAENRESHIHQLEQIRTSHRADIEAIETKHKSEKRDLIHRHKEALRDVASRHERGLAHATEDATRENYFLTQKLDIAYSEVDHLKSNVKQLESHLSSLSENFKTASLAAQAAASAATSNTRNQSDDRALRESLTVLQSQLQEREARIEELQQQVDEYRKAGDSLKQVESQLSLFRELADMRIDDLEEIIHMCSMPHVDRNGLRDAATRLKAALAMQRQEAERLGPAIPSANSGTATPTGATAAAAIQEGLQSVTAKLPWGGLRWGSGPAKPANKPVQVPTPDSRPGSSASGFLNGLLTSNQQQATAPSPQPRFSAIGRSQPRPESSLQGSVVGRGAYGGSTMGMGRLRTDSNVSRASASTITGGRRNMLGERAKRDLLRYQAYDEDAREGGSSIGGGRSDDEQHHQEDEEEEQEAEERDSHIGLYEEEDEEGRSIFERLR